MQENQFNKVLEAMNNALNSLPISTYDKINRYISNTLREIEIEAAINQKNYIKEISNQLILFRSQIFNTLKWLMITETILLFIILVLASLKIEKYFKIDATTLRILVGATLTQISIMIIWIIKSVFPAKLNDIIINSSFKNEVTALKGRNS